MSARLAKRLVEPTWSTAPTYVQTYGPEVASVCAAAGLVPDPEQELGLDLIFAIDANARSAAFEIDVIAARQNLKTALILMAEIGWLYVTDERLVVHSAHMLDTTEEAFVDLRNLITSTPALSRRLAPGTSGGIFEGSGRWRIELATGQRLKYRARTKGGGRGLTGNKVVLDEGYALLPTHMGALLPTLSAVPDPQVLTASSAGKAESAVLRDKRDRGRKGLSPRQVYLEWGDPEPWTGCRDGDDCRHAKSAKGCALDDEARWARTNVALGRRITLETLRAMRQAMPPLEFAREFLVWWDESAVDDGARSINLDRWTHALNPGAPRLRRAALAIDVAPGMGSASIALAGPHGDRTLVLVRHGEGIGWIVKALRKLARRLDVVEVALAPGDRTKALLTRLDKAGIEYRTLTAAEVGQACGGLVAAVDEGLIEHVGQPELDAAVATARAATGSSERVARLDPSIDLTPAVAAAIAVNRWAAHDSSDYDVEDSFL